MKHQIDYGIASEEETQARKHGRRASIAGFVGTALEYYDLYIYAAASSLIFSRVFFPDSGSFGILLALSTYGVAYLARPLGGFLAGHYGDRVGRRNVLLVILVVMGLATFAIGCLPSYEAIGIWAPILLVVFRIAQGLSAGGELSSSASLTAEHAPEGRRGLYTSFSATGSVFGYLIATLIFLAVSSLPEEDMLSWGWRIPFWFSIVIVGVGIFVRWFIDEPEVFVQQQKQGAIRKLPLLDVLQTQRSDFVKVVLSSLQIVVSVIVPVYGLTYATNVVGIPTSTILSAIAVAYAIALVFNPLGGHLSDKFGRKPVLIGANIVAAISVWPFYWALANEHTPMIYLSMIFSYSVAWGMINGVYPLFYSEQFSTRFRITGMAVGLQIGLILTGFSPLIAQLLSSANGDAWWPVAVVSTVCSVIAIITIITMRETFRSRMSELDRKTPNEYT